MKILAIYKSLSGNTALQVLGDSTAIDGASVFRLDGDAWCAVDYASIEHDASAEEIQSLAEHLDTVKFDVSLCEFMVSAGMMKVDE